MALNASDILGGAGLAAAFVFLGVLVRQYVPWRKIRLDADTDLRHDLLERVSRLEDTLDKERIHREAERVRHEAERALDRHRLNNVTTCFDALLLLIEMEPARAQEAAQKIKAMRAEQMKAEALEKGIIVAAEINAAGDPHAH